MLTIKKSANGKVLLSQRIAGFAVSVREPVWSKTCRMFEHDWRTVSAGLTLADAESTFASLAA